jgi:hypothetical protein
MGERMSGKEFGENRKFKMAARGSFSMKKLQFCLLIKVGSIVFILGENMAKYKDLP